MVPAAPKTSLASCTLTWAWRLSIQLSERRQPSPSPEKTLDRLYSAARESLGSASAGPARRFLNTYERMPFDVWLQRYDLEPLVEGVVAELHVLSPKRVKELADLCGSIALIARFPAAHERLRRLAEKVAAREAARGLMPDPDALAALDLQDLPRPARPKLSAELEEVVDAFAPGARGVAAWLLADHPALAADAKSLGTDASDLSARHQTWLLNRLRSDAYFPTTPCPPLRLPVRRVADILSSPTAVAPLWAAAITALGRPELEPVVASTIASLSTTTLGRLAAAFPLARTDAVMAAVADELAYRRDELAVELPIARSHLGDILTDPGKNRVLAPHDRRDGVARADAFIAAGSAFFGDAVKNALKDYAQMCREHGVDAKGEPGERIAALRAHCLELVEAKRTELVDTSGIDEELAAALASTISISGGQERDRARLFENLVYGVRLSRGAALHRLHRATVIADKDRASYEAGTLNSPAGNTRAIMHEMGHALEFARADVTEAAAAFLARRKIGDTAHPMNDLLVVWSLSWIAGADSQRRLLARLSDHPTGRPLNSREALLELAEGLGFEAAIDKLCAQDLAKVRSYEKEEPSFPVVGDPYLARAYTKGTEVVSMGVDKLATADGLFQALLRDAEHICFTVGALLSERDAATTR